MAGTRRIYAGKDFATLVSEVRSKLVRQFPDVVFDFENDLTVVLLQLVAYALENTHFFQDLQANEVFAETAQLPSFLSKIASFHAYNPAGAVPASGEVGVSLNEAQTRTVLLEVGQQVAANNGLPYEATQQALWAPGDTSEKLITFAQKETRSQSFRSDGTRLQRFPLDVSEGAFLSYRSLVVTVDGDEWEELDKLADLSTEAYRVAYTADPPFIEFGDGAVGTIPPDGAEIFVVYAETNGIAGVLSSPGQITALSPSLQAGGVQIVTTINEETGIMTGGRGPEVSSLIRANIPLAEHSDQAVVIDDDFEGLVERYSDPLYGAVAAATAVVATSIDNDLVASLLLGQLRSLFFDADDVVESSATDLRAIASNIGDNASEISSRVAAIIAEVEAAGTIQSDTAAIVAEKDAAAIQVNLGTDESETVDSSATAAASQVTTAQGESSDIRSTITGIGGGAGSDQLTTATFDSLIADLDALDDALTEALSRVDASGAIQNSTAAIRTALSSIKGNLATIETTTESIDDTAGGVEADANLISTEVTSIQSELTDHESTLVVCESTLEDPWDSAVAKIDELEAHLDSIIADNECGPNVVSVPILTADADGFFIQPSVGLQRAVEEYINARKEPSVVFEVLDGSVFIVTPAISITFEPESGEVPSKLKGEGEANVLSLVRGFKFGAALNLDDLYDSVRPIDNVVKWNVEITGFQTENPNTEATIDSDGNLTVGGLEVVGKPDLTFFRRFPDGSKELI